MNLPKRASCLNICNYISFGGLLILVLGGSPQTINRNSHLFVYSTSSPLESKVVSTYGPIMSHHTYYICNTQSYVHTFSLPIPCIFHHSLTKLSPCFHLQTILSSTWIYSVSTTLICEHINLIIELFGIDSHEITCNGTIHIFVFDCPQGKYVYLT